MPIDLLLKQVEKAADANGNEDISHLVKLEVTTHPSSGVALG